MTLTLPFRRLPSALLLGAVLTTPLASAGPICTIPANVLASAAKTVEGEEKWCCCGACCGYAVNCKAIPGCDSC